MLSLPRLVAAVLFLALAFPAQGQDSGGTIVPPPKPGDTCPVCGMFVAKYPEWVATVLWKDGHSHHFDGAKDLFKYLLRLDKYAPGHTADDMVAVVVTDYYGVEKVDAKTALYVIGSDVYGPMGHELVPMANKADADEFMRDHKGERVVTFGEVTWDLLIELDKRGE